jgi:hypothetical protein
MRVVPQVARRWAEPDAGSDTLLYMSQLNLSARAYYRTRSVKLARTILLLLRNNESANEYETPKTENFGVFLVKSSH